MTLVAGRWDCLFAGIDYSEKSRSHVKEPSSLLYHSSSLRSFPRYHIRVSRREPDIWRAPPTREHSGETYGSTGLAERSSLLLLLLLRSDQAVITRRVNRVACAPSREVEEEKRDEERRDRALLLVHLRDLSTGPPATTTDTAARTGYTRNPASASSTPMRTDLPPLL